MVSDTCGTVPFSNGAAFATPIKVQRKHFQKNLKKG